MRMTSFMLIAALLLAFVAGTGFGIYSVKKAERVVAAPLVIDFCSLATNQDYLEGARIETNAEMILGLEGGVLTSGSCPDSMLVFRGPGNDACWQKIISDYKHNGANTDFFVQVEGSIRGRRRLVSWFHAGSMPKKDAAHRAPQVTIDIERITNCTRK